MMRFFDPPVGKTKFHDLVNQGLVVKVRGLRGYYRLNESLVRLGLQPVKELPKAHKTSDEDIVELSLAIAAPDVVDPPMWMEDGLKQSDVAKALVLAERWMAELEDPADPVSDPDERREYAQGIRDGQWVLERQGKTALDAIPGSKGEE
jgi:hypothetical protein